MGGAVAITVRLNEDETYKMEWGTGGINILKLYDFLEQTPEFMAEKRIIWKDPEYAAPLAPSGYGLVVADFVSKRIIGCQNYTRINTLGFINVLNLRDDDDHEEELENLHNLIDSGRVNKITSNLYDTAIIHLSEFGDTKEKALEELTRRFRHSFKTREDRFHWGAFLIEPKPIEKVDDFDHLDKKGWLEFKRVLVEEMKFTLSEEDEAAWSEWIKWKEEEDAEDAAEDAAAAEV